jgi:primosomal protein N' (replication factor Y)
VTVGGGADRYVARTASWENLGRALIAAPRPKGSRVRIEVDPPRL